MKRTIEQRWHDPGGSGSRLLHNMSCAPRAQISYRSPYRRAGNRGIIFALSAGNDVLAGLLPASRPGELGFTAAADAE